jgi:hypothetical protein
MIFSTNAKANNATKTAINVVFLLSDVGFSVESVNDVDKKMLVKISKTKIYGCKAGQLEYFKYESFSVYYEEWFYFRSLVKHCMLN